jgi:hypothetical protein
MSKGVQQGDASLVMLAIVVIAAAIWMWGQWDGRRGASQSECEARGFTHGEFKEGRVACWNKEPEVVHD